MSFIALQFVSDECIRRRFGANAIPIEISPSGLITRAESVDYKHNITSLPTSESGMAGKMTALLLK